MLFWKVAWFSSCYPFVLADWSWPSVNWQWMHSHDSFCFSRSYQLLSSCYLQNTHTWLPVEAVFRVRWYISTERLVIQGPSHLILGWGAVIHTGLHWLALLSTFAEWYGHLIILWNGAYLDRWNTQYQPITSVVGNAKPHVARMTYQSWWDDTESWRTLTCLPRFSLAVDRFSALRVNGSLGRGWEGGRQRREKHSPAFFMSIKR